MADFNPIEDFAVGPADVSLVIPTLNASWGLPGLLERIDRQTLRPAEVLVVDSSSDDGTADIARAHGGVRVEVIGRSAFNHGLTRHEALLSTSGRYVCFMTQDAVPADSRYFENLLALFADPEVALVSGRQLPKPDARRFEQLVREFNYGPDPNVRSAEDIPRYGIKAFFASDVCSAYRRDAYLAAGGFPRLDMSEDMYMAARFVNAGLKVAYAADARVYHSHNLTPSEQYARNRAIGEFLEEHAAMLGYVQEADEGSSLAKMVSLQLLREGRLLELTAFGIDCAARLAGNRMGRQAARKGKWDEGTLVGAPFPVSK